MSKFLLGSLTNGSLAFEKGDSLVMKRMRTCPGRAQEYNVGAVVPVAAKFRSGDVGWLRSPADGLTVPTVAMKIVTEVCK